MSIRLELMDEQDFPQIIEWVNQYDRDFIIQWAGLTYNYPLTLDQMKGHYHKGINSFESDVFIYRIIDSETNKFVGTIQICRFNHEKRDAVVGRFLIGNESDRGRGIGKSSLMKLIEIGFNKFELRTIRLNVFDFNTHAIKCYEGIGFRKNHIKENVYMSDKGLIWNNIEMILDREQFLRVIQEGIDIT